MTSTRIHPETGKILHRDTRARTVQFGSLSREVPVSGWYPDDDSDSIHTGAELKVSDDAFKALRAEYAALVKTVRKSVNLSQEEAGRIIGGGRRGFQKYESGKTPPSVAAVGLIELLRRRPQDIAVLRSLHDPSPKTPARPTKQHMGGARKGQAANRSNKAAHS